MTEILFRGKTVFNGTIGSAKWVESENFRCDNGRWYIGGYRVADETVGQYTGLTDKNGVKIFEGDKIIYHHSPTKLVDVESHEIDPYKKRYQREDDEGLVIVQQYRKIDKVIKIKGVVNFSILSGVDISFKNNANYHWWDNVENIEVIGNIHDDEVQ